MDSSGQSVLQFMIKAKFRRKESQVLLLLISILYLIDFGDTHSLTPSSPGSSSCGDVFCLHGSCVDGKCVCDRGWQGSACHRCGGRIKLDAPSGFITDGFTNYSTDLQCTWLIDSGSRDAVIRMQLIEFETECSWDHLYVFDGDSVFSPLVAAYSGLLVKNGHSYQEVPEIVAHSGRAYLYFYSDAAYNMSGFNVSYSINGCPKNCSRHGACGENGICICDGGFDGDACDIEICPNNCKPNGDCDREARKCRCHASFTGSDCSQRESQGSWLLIPGPKQTSGRALHAAASEGSFMYITGGDFFKHHKNKDPPFMVRFDFLTGEWKTINPNRGDIPGHRFGHTLTLYHKRLYLFGGIFLNGSVANDLWYFDVNSMMWTKIPSDQSLHPLTCLMEFCGPVQTTGHSASLVDERLIFIFGHNPVYGYLNIVQEYDIKEDTWKIIQGRGAVVKGGFGHSAAFDPVSRKIFVYAGYHSYGTDSVLVDLLYSYDPDKHFWQLRNPSHSPRYLHTASVINGAMIVFGGNAHNATHNNGGDKCFSPQVLMYDIECDSWHTLQDPGTSLKRNLETGRYGHSMVLHDNSLYSFGGFNGLMLNSILKFTPGNSCLDLTSKSQCITSKPGIVCHWNAEKGLCSPASQMKQSTSRYSSMGFLSKEKCQGDQRTSNFTDLCFKQSSCPSCLETTYNCVWCSDSCSHEKCRKPGIKGFSEPLRCDDDRFVTSNCDKLHNCHACHTEPHCGWQRDHKCYTFVKDVGNKTQKAIVNPDLRPICDIPCHLRTSCFNCSSGPSCMWCNSLQRCIESNAYAAIFPIAQCMEWTIHSNKCLNCSDIQTCDKCQQNPRCGWCDDGHKSGVGTCMEGAGEGPYDWSSVGPALNQTKCPSSRWFFSSCPQCQCNGHAVCSKDPRVCDSCSHLTEGTHCQDCQPSYYGNPVNGGTCKPCSCNNHSHQCNRETGKCHCTTKGIIGDTCDRCDEQNHYFGNPTERGGSCFYNLTIDFQYTFNMSKSDDRYLNRINFMNVPMKADVDVDFTVACSRNAVFNISIGSSKSMFDRRVTQTNYSFPQTLFPFDPWLTTSSARLPHINFDFLMTNICLEQKTRHSTSMSTDLKRPSSCRSPSLSIGLWTCFSSSSRFPHVSSLFLSSQLFFGK